MTTTLEKAITEQWICDFCFKDYGLIPEYIEEVYLSNGNVAKWIPHFSPKELKFTINQDGEVSIKK